VSPRRAGAGSTFFTGEPVHCGASRPRGVAILDGTEPKTRTTRGHPLEISAGVDSAYPPGLCSGLAPDGVFLPDLDRRACGSASRASAGYCFL